MNNHSILLYPLNIEEIFTIDEWTNAYDVYFKGMIGIEKNVVKEEALTFIKQLES